VIIGALTGSSKNFTDAFITKMRLQIMLLLKGEADGIQGANRYALFTNNATAQIELQLPVWGPAAQSTTGAHT